LFIPAIASVAIMNIILIIWYNVFLLLYPSIFNDWWNVTALSGIKIISIPLEEYIWHSAMVFSINPLYELVFGYKDKN